MTNKRYFLLAGILAFIGLAGISCSVNGENYPSTLTPTPLTMASVTPSITPLPTLIPLMPLTYPTTIPYPTANVVKSNAVAFIAKNSLWIANVDGSGERKLTDFTKNDSLGRVQMQWSPNGKWISYISEDALWIISPDGSTNKKILSGQDSDKKVIRQYTWSPDGSEIAYTLALNRGDFTEFKTGLLDLTTGKDTEILVYESPADFTVSWSPDGHHILVNTRNSIKVFDVSAGKITKEIKSACPIWRGGPVWSPKSKWFYRADSGSGSYYVWVCVNGLDGTSWQAIDGVISQPVWDETGNFLYFITRKSNLNNTLNLKVNEQLMLYDVRTQETKRLLPLIIKHTPYSFMHSISISPDRRTLLLRSQYSETEFDLIFINLQSLTTTKYTVDFEDLKIPFLYSYILETAWSPDNQNLVMFAGDFCTPSGCGGWGPNGYGSFYTLNTKTGKVSIFSGEHSIYSWQVSPIATSP